MILFLRHFILLTCLSVHCCYSVIVIDIETQRGIMHVTEQTKQSIPVSNSLKIVTFDTDTQKITSICFLGYNPRESTYNGFNLGTFVFGFTPSHMTDFTITPLDNFTGIIRRDGAFTYNLGTGNVQATSLSHLDETRPGLMGLFLGNYVANTFDNFAAALSCHDVLEQCKQKKITEVQGEIERLDNKDKPHLYTLTHSKSSTQKYKKAQEQVTKNATDRQQKLDRISAIESGDEITNRTGVTPTDDHAWMYWNTRVQKHPAYITFASIPNADELCELACDLTMMAQSFTKLNGKYGGNKGFDGLYKGSDRIIAAESKFWKHPPTLHTVISEKIAPKFDFAHQGAISHISETSQRLINESYDVHKIYMLAYAMLANGKIDCRLEYFTGTIDFPKPQLIAVSIKAEVKVAEENAEVSNESKASDLAEPVTPLTQATTFDVSLLTPQTDQKDMQKVFNNFLSSFKEKTGMSVDQLKEMFGLSITHTTPIPFSLEGADI